MKRRKEERTVEMAVTQQGDGVCSLPRTANGAQSDNR